MSERVVQNTVQHIPDVPCHTDVPEPEATRELQMSFLIVAPYRIMAILDLSSSRITSYSDRD